MNEPKYAKAYYGKHHDYHEPLQQPSPAHTAFIHAR